MGSLGAMAFFMNSGGGLEVASVQYGSISITHPDLSNTATITSVNTSRAVVICLGLTSNYNATLDGTGLSEGTARVTLTNATTVTASRSGGGTYDMTIGFMVIEFAPGSVKSIQDVTISGADGTTSNTATITSVNTTKAAVFQRTIGFMCSANSANATWATTATKTTLTNSTTLTMTRNTASSPNGRVDNYVTVVEFN